MFDKDQIWIAGGTQRRGALSFLFLFLTEDTFYRFPNDGRLIFDRSQDIPYKFSRENEVEIFHDCVCNALTLSP